MSNVIDVSPGPDALFGTTDNPNASGVFGVNTAGGVGITGKSDLGIGIKGESQNGRGVVGASEHLDGVNGISLAENGHGVTGNNLINQALGFLAGNDPVFGQHAGVYGQSDLQGVMGLSTSDTGTGVYGGNTNENAAGIGVRGETMRGIGVKGVSFTPDGKAGIFIGTVEISQFLPDGSFIPANLHCDGEVTAEGNLTCNGQVTVKHKVVAFDIELEGMDCAEDFDVKGAETVEPGTVMVIDSEGFLSPCDQAYDRRVSGVISGAGNIKPGIILGKRDSESIRLPLALVGRAFCKVDARTLPIGVGDLLTTSETRGHAMRVDDPARAFGSVIGKALRPLNTGLGMIPILIALQ